MTLKSLTSAALLAAVLQGCGGNSPSSALPAAVSAAGPLNGAITSAIPGLSQAQAALGAGSLLGLAKTKMPAGQYSQVAGAIPGADALVGEAVKQGAPTSPSSLSAVTDFLGKSGISPSQVNQLIPVLTKAISGKVPAEVSSALASALM